MREDVRLLGRDAVAIVAITYAAACAAKGETVFLAPSDATVVASVQPAARGLAREVFVQDNSTSLSPSATLSYASAGT